MKLNNLMITTNILVIDIENVLVTVVDLSAENQEKVINNQEKYSEQLIMIRNIEKQNELVFY